MTAALRSIQVRPTIGGFVVVAVMSDGTEQKTERFSSFDSAKAHAKSVAAELSKHGIKGRITKDEAPQ